jgi:UDP-glucuronate decarboxylase
MPITIYGSGQQTRSFCYVSDLLDGFLKLMATSDDITGPINLGNPHEITMLQLTESVIKLTNSSSKLVFKDAPIDDPAQRRPDITQAQQKLSWQPQVSLEEGLKETINYFDALIRKNGITAQSLA